MKWLLVLLAFLVLAVGLTHYIQQDNGYVLIGIDHFTLESSLVFFVAVNLLAWGVLYILLRFVLNMFGVPEHVREWRSRRAVRRARDSLNQGLIELYEGNWKAAEKTLIRYVSNSETPLLNYLTAARAAQQQGAHERRDQYLQQAHESMPSADIAVGLTQAELQLSHQQLEQALATLMHLKQLSPRHNYVLKLLQEVYRRLGDWDALKELLPELRKRKALDEDALVELERAIFTEMLNRAAARSDVSELQDAWAKMPRNLRSDIQMIELYVPMLLELDRHEAAAELAAVTLQREWNEQLVYLYKLAEQEDAAKQLATAESWIQKYPEHPALLRTLGRLCLRNRLWGKARSYLEASLGLDPDPAAYLELGTLLEQMGDHEAAGHWYREGLRAATDQCIPDIPLIREGAEAVPLAPGETDVDYDESVGSESTIVRPVI